MSVSSMKSYLKNGAGGAVLATVVGVGGVIGAVASGMVDGHSMNMLLEQFHLATLSEFGASASIEGLMAFSAGVGASAGVAKRAVQDRVKTMIEKAVSLERGKTDRGMDDKALLNPALDVGIDLDAVREAHYGARRKPEADVLPNLELEGR